MACMLVRFCRQFEHLWLAGMLAKLVECDGGVAWVDVQIGLGYYQQPTGKRSHGDLMT